MNGIPENGTPCNSGSFLRSHLWSGTSVHMLALLLRGNYRILEKGEWNSIPVYRGLQIEVEVEGPWQVPRKLIRILEIWGPESPDV